MNAPAARLLARRITFVAIGLVVAGSAARAEEGDSLVSLSERYVKLLAATMEEKATPKDVDELLALCTDDMIYEHPRVGARIQGKEQGRRGRAGFLGATRNPSLKIKNRIAGRGIVVLELALTAEAKRDAGWEPMVRTQVTILETDGSRIRRIADYW